MPSTTTAGAGSPGRAGKHAACRTSTKARRSASSGQRVNVSSNWSTMMTGRVPGAATRRAQAETAARTASGEGTERTASGAGAPEFPAPECPTAGPSEFSVRGPLDATEPSDVSVPVLSPAETTGPRSGMRRASSARGSLPGTSCTTVPARPFSSPSPPSPPSMPSWRPSAPALSAGTRPAFSSEDFPAPDAPTSMTSPPRSATPRSWATSASVHRSRPKNQLASSRRYEASPRYGHTPAGADGASAAGPSSAGDAAPRSPTGSATALSHSRCQWPRSYRPGDTGVGRARRASGISTCSTAARAVN